MGQSYPDFIACWAGLTALFAALQVRRATGEGQWIDVSMYQVGAALVPEALLQFQVDGTQPQRIGNEHDQFVPGNAYAARGEDRWLALTVESDAQWQALCTAMRRPELGADVRFATGEARRAHREQVDAVVAGWAREQDVFEAMRVLQGAGIACGPVLNNRDLLLDPHLRARGFHERVVHSAPMGPRPIMGRPYRWRNRQPHVQHPAPAYAEHNRAILRALPGYTQEKVEGLIADGVAWDGPKVLRPPEAMGLAQLKLMRAICDVDADYREKLGIV